MSAKNISILFQTWYSRKEFSEEVPLNQDLNIVSGLLNTNSTEEKNYKQQIWVPLVKACAFEEWTGKWQALGSNTLESPEGHLSHTR